MFEIIFILVTILGFGLLGIGQLSNKNINLIAYFIGALLLLFVGLGIRAEGITTNQISNIQTSVDVNGNISNYDLNYSSLTPSNDFGTDITSYLYFILGFVFFLIGGAELFWKKKTKGIMEG